VLIKIPVIAINTKLKAEIKPAPLNLETQLSLKGKNNKAIQGTTKHKPIKMAIILCKLPLVITSYQKEYVAAKDAIERSPNVKYNAISIILYMF
tara:strand:+ start:2195 stop:2476 length:282 start_codon:yes stop_codon:yes gene_type:complete